MSKATTRAALMTEHRDYIDGYAAGLADGRRIAPQPAVPVVSDEQIDALAAGNNYPGTVPGYRRFARAILARRPVQVPMTDDGVDAKCLTIIGHLLSRRERDRIVWRMAEAHHGITAKAEDAHQPTKEAEKP